MRRIIMDRSFSSSHSSGGGGGGSSSGGKDESTGGGGNNEKDSRDIFKKRRMDIKVENEPSGKKPCSNPNNNSPTGSGSGTTSTSPQANKGVVQSWQESKGSIKERTSCLVNSERLSDITFYVGQMETPVYGHKTILSAGSPYFEKLFFGPMAIKENTHKVPDMEPEVFLQFLKYLYTDEFDEASMDAVDALLLLKPAKIYIVPHLAIKCAELLIDRLSAENVFLIYNRAVVFDEPKLAEVCLRFLDREIDKVLVAEEFMEIEVDTLVTLLQRENLRINECVLFKSILKWAEAECKRKEIECTPTNQREVLGKALNLIRFPAMTREEFALDVVPTSVLTKDEVIGVFMTLCIGDEQKQCRPATPFTADRRVYQPKFYYVNRFVDVLSKGFHFSSFCPGDSVYNSSIKFRTDQRVFIKGAGIYGISSSIPGLKFNATVSLFRSRSVPEVSMKGASSVTFAFGQLLGTKQMEGSCRTYDFRMPFQVVFDSPLEVKPEDEYSLNAVLKVVRETSLCGSAFPFTSSSNAHSGFSYGNQIDAYYGTKPLSTVYVPCTDGIKVNFTFPNAAAGESFSTGQIPQIIFSI